MHDLGTLEQLWDRLPPGWKPSGSPLVDSLYSLRAGGDGPRRGVRHLNLLYAGSTLVARTSDLNQALRTLERSLDFDVAIRSPRRLFVQAGVVRWRGQLIVVPGRSMSGKTTLVAALVRAGAVYYSDEYALFDANGRVHPYPRPLAVRDASGIAARVTVSELGGRAGTTALLPAVILFTQYRSDKRWRPQRLAPAEAMMGLLEHTVLARVRPAAALASFRRAVQEAVALKGARGDAVEVVSSLMKRFDGKQPARLQHGSGARAHLSSHGRREEA